MRNIKAINSVQRIIHLNKNAYLIPGASSSTILANRCGQKSKTFEPIKQSVRYSSGGSHGSSSEFNRTTIIYTLFGSALCGGMIAAYVHFSGEKQTKKSAAPVSRPKREESAAAVEEESSEAAEESASEPEAEQAEEKVEQKEAPKKEEPVKAAPAAAAAAAPSATPAEKDQDKFLPEIPSYAQYLIVGGGTAAMSAFKAIRANDPKARILVVTEEDYKPYMRPPLSKDLLLTEDENLIKQLKFKQYNGNERSLFFIEDEFYVPPKTLNQNENGGVAVVTGKRVTQVDVQNKTVRLDNNWEITYDKCLIATGGKPKNLPVFQQSWDKFKDKVTLFRNIEDFKRLYSVVKEGKTIAIVGGGFLGSELACALGKLSKKYGGKVIQIFPEQGNLGKVLPEYLSKWTTDKVKEEGVSIIPKTVITDAKLNDNKIELNLESSVKNETLNTKWLLADHVIVAVGLEPNVQLATQSGFEIDPKFGGYLVNAELQARNSIWVAGDAASFYDIKLGRRRVEHHDHAVVSGRLAGENMTGAGKPYWHQSMFWSDIGPKIGFEAIGLVDSSLQTVGLFAKADETDTPQALVGESNETLRSEIKDTKLSETTSNANNLQTPTSMDEYGKGVVFYLKNNTIVGVLLWNLFKRIPIARQIIQSQEKASDYTELAKLFKIDASGLEESGSN